MGALSFRLLSANAGLALLDTLFSNFGNYPLTIFSVLQFLLTFGIPLAFMPTFPRRFSWAGPRNSR